MTILQLFLILLAVSLVPVAFIAARTYLKYRGTRVVTCPETQKPVAVRVDKRHAVATTAAGDPDLRLESCTRWPERQHCGQECLAQIEASPDECLVRNILVRSYAGSSCALCGKPIGEIHWTDNRPALLSPERKTIEWADVPPEKLPGVLATHQKVCWNCHIAATFRNQFPGLPIERPARPERRV